MDPAYDIFTTSYVYRSIMLEKLLTSTTPVMSLREVLMLFLNTLVTHGYGIVYVLVVGLMEASAILTHIQVYFWVDVVADSCIG